MATARAARQREQYLARQGLRAAPSSFRAVTSDRTRLRTHGGGGDYHADDRSREFLRDLSRDLERNAEAYTVLIRGSARLIGSPLPRPTTPDAAWNKLALQRFKARARLTRGGFDQRGTMNWFGLCKQWWGAWLRDGDVAAAPTLEGAIETYEADQIAGRAPGNQHRRTVGGVVINSANQTVGYMIAPRNRTGHIDARSAVMVADDEMTMLSSPWYASQTRSLPVLVSGLDNVERGDGLVESETISAEQASNIYGAFQRQLADGQIPTDVALSGGGNPAPNYSGDNADTGDIPNGGIPDPVDWAAGSYFDLPPGVTWETFKSERPNLNVTELLRQMVMQSSAVIGFPYPVLYADFKNINWSTNRGLVSLTRDAQKNLRQDYCEPFIDPFWAWWVADEIANGRMRAPRDENGKEIVDNRIFDHRWDWPTSPEWPDPYKEEQRHSIALDQGTDSLHRILGDEWSEILEERTVEKMKEDELYVRRLVAANKLVEAYTELGLSLADIINRPSPTLSAPAGTEHNDIRMRMDELEQPT